MSETNRSVADRNLLFGILALQLNFIDRDALVAAMHAWVLDKASPLGSILVKQQKLNVAQLQALDSLIEQHLRVHSDNAELSLRSCRVGSVVSDDLIQVDDADVQYSLGHLQTPGAADVTASLSRMNTDSARYQKLRHHAGGGLGDVYVAADKELHREVALKEIKAKYADHPSNRTRFILEAEITGGLEHPGIVPVYGLGVHADGRPYYAMRFIRGDNLKVAIDQFHAADKPGRDAGERSLAFRQLLRRFIDVCNAVAYAHSRGVVHRDLKPANVMLGKYGETLVVDWGLAKAGGKTRSASAADSAEAENTLRPASGSSVEATLDGILIGTPAFMSPEQAEGRVMDLSQASDIYSLGSTLYVLLTGKSPYEGATKEDTLVKVRRGIYLSPQQRKPETPAALDAICRKAMSQRPVDRYASAFDLATDVEHWLADEPVAAYPEPWTTRAGRWARRHRAAVAGIGAFLVCAIVALSISTVLIAAEQRRTAAQAEIALEQKQLAVENYKLSRDQSFNIIELIESSEAEIASRPALHKTRKDILVLVSNACRRYLKQDPADKELRRRSAQVYRYAANVHRLTDENAGADPLYRGAIKLYEGLAQEFPDETRFGQQLSDTWRDQAKLQSNVGRLREATDSLQRSVTLIEELMRDRAGQPTLRRTLAANLVSLAGVQNKRGLYAESAQSSERAAAIYRELIALPAVKQRHPYDAVLLAAALNLNVVCQREMHGAEAAVEAHREPVKLLYDLAENPPAGVNVNDIKHFYASCQLEQFRTWVKTGDDKRLQNADEGFTAVITTWQTLAENFPQVPMYRDSLGFALLVRGQLRAQGPTREAEALVDLEESRKLLENRVEESPDIPSPRGDLGRTYLALGRLAKKAKDPAAEEWIRKAIESLEKSLSLSPDNVQDRKSLSEAKAELLKQ